MGDNSSLVPVTATVRLRNLVKAGSLTFGLHNGSSLLTLSGSWPKCLAVNATFANAFQALKEVKAYE